MHRPTRAQPPARRLPAALVALALGLAVEGAAAAAPAAPPGGPPWPEGPLAVTPAGRLFEASLQFAEAARVEEAALTAALRRGTRDPGAAEQVIRGAYAVGVLWTLASQPERGWEALAGALRHRTVFRLGARRRCPLMQLAVALAPDKRALAGRREALALAGNEPSCRVAASRAAVAIAHEERSDGRALAARDRLQTVLAGCRGRRAPSDPAGIDACAEAQVALGDTLALLALPAVPPRVASLAEVKRLLRDAERGFKAAERAYVVGVASMPAPRAVEALVQDAELNLAFARWLVAFPGPEGLGDDAGDAYRDGIASLGEPFRARAANLFERGLLLAAGSDVYNAATRRAREWLEAEAPTRYGPFLRLRVPLPGPPDEPGAACAPSAAAAERAHERALAALESAQATLARAPAAGVLAQAAAAWLQLGLPLQARHAAALVPEAARVVGDWLVLARARLALGDDVGARAAFRWAGALAPEDPTVGRFAAHFALVTLRFETARAEAQRAAQRAANEALPWLQLGAAAVGLGRLDEATAAFERVLEIDANATEARWNLAQVFLARAAAGGDLALPALRRAEALLGQLLEACPDDPEARTERSLVGAILRAPLPAPPLPAAP